MTRMVGTGQAPQGYHEGQVFDVPDVDEGTVEDLERKGWAKRLDPKQDIGHDKVSVANAMVRGDSVNDPVDREVAREIGSHDAALAIVHTQDPDGTQEDYDAEVADAGGRDALGRPLGEGEKGVLASDVSRAASGGQDWTGEAPAPAPEAPKTPKKKAGEEGS